MRRRTWFPWPLVGLMIAGACGPDGADRVCDPGETQSCLCVGDAVGVQVCREDASGWESCQCGGGGDDDTGIPADDDTVDDGVYAPVSGVSVEVHDDVETLLVVSWTQDADADAAWLEFTFEDDVWSSSPAVARDAGEHSEVVLGVPGDTEVTVRIVNEIGGEVLASKEEWTETTGEVPDDLPAPSLVSWDEEIDSDGRWLFGSLEAQSSNWYSGDFWLFILDRQGRIVWYYEVPGDRCTMHAKVARDGTHLLFEETTIYLGDQGEDSELRRLTLDGEYDEDIEVPFLGSTFDETDEGTIVFDDYDQYPTLWLTEQMADGTRRDIWNCNAWIQPLGGSTYQCDPNETLWFPESDTILWSMWGSDSAVEIDRQSGDLLRQFGQISGSYTFEPAETGFDMQHYPNFTDTGTLLVSTHIPGQSGQQRALEFEIDDASQTLVEIWSYGEEVPHYATFAGEAIRLDNGNTLINYGTSADIREVTPDKKTAWEVAWAATYLIGHVTFVSDLYELNRGPGG